MATGRILRKQISLSERVNDLPLKTALLFTWAITHADDFGRMNGSARRVKHEVVPMRNDISIGDVEQCLQELHDAGLIIWYTHSGESFIQFPNWERHQVGLHKRTESKFPPAPPPAEMSNPESPGDSGKFLPNRTEQKRTEENRTEEKGRAPDGTANPPQPSEEGDATETERLILHELKQVKRYPFDYAKDLEAIRALSVKFPGVDILDECQKWAIYKLDKPLDAKANPRSQLRMWLSKAEEFRARPSINRSFGRPSHSTGLNSRDVPRG